MTAVWIVGLLAGLVIARFVYLSATSTPPHRLGPQNGRLAPCPRKPNCVSSQARGKVHSIATLRAGRSEAEALVAARRAIESMPRARITTVEGGYLHAEFRSRLFRFVDDLELLYDDETGDLHVRSASRVGNSDLGANRKRVEELRRRLAEALR